MKLLLISFFLLLPFANVSAANQQSKNQLLANIYQFYAQASCTSIKRVIKLEKPHQINVKNAVKLRCLHVPVINSLYKYHQVSDSSYQVNLSMSWQGMANQPQKYQQQVTLDKTLSGDNTVTVLTTSVHSTDLIAQHNYSEELLIKSFVYRWVDTLDSFKTVNNVNGFISDFSSFGLADVNLTNSQLLSNWLINRKKHLSKTGHRIGRISISKIEEGSYKVSFDYDYKEIDVFNVSAIARVNAVWVFKTRQDKLKLDSITEKYLPPKLDSISNIEC